MIDKIKIIFINLLLIEQPNKANDLRNKLNQYYRQNHFFNYSKDQLLEFINEHKTKYSCNTQTFLYSKDFNDLVYKQIIIDIHSAFTSNFSELIPESLLNESVLVLILCFLANCNRAEIQDYRKIVILNLINLCAFQTDEEKENFGKYDSGIFARFVINIIKLSQACLLYFFVGRVFLNNDFMLAEIENLFVKKEKIGNLTYEGLKDYFHKKLKLVNKEISEDNVDVLCLPFVFEPIKKCKYII